MGDAATSLETSHWWQRPFAMLQTNLREIDADMDVDHVADYIQRYGAGAWLIGIGGIQAQYPSELPFHTTNERISNRKSGDLIKDAIQAAHSRGLRLLARMDFSKVSAERAAEHPEWLYRSPSGELQKHTGDLVSVCPSAEYYQERLFDILDEVTKRYAIDGMFINWTTMNEMDYYKRYWGVCHCDSCKSRWVHFSGGKELPKDPSDEHYAAWYGWSRDLLDDLTGRVRAFLVERLPSACLIWGKSSDIMFHEANNAVDRELFHHATSATVSAWASYRPQVPVLINATTFMDMPYRMASEQPAHFAQYLLQAISRGGRPSTYMMSYPDRIPYLCMDIGSQITQFYKNSLSVYDGLRPCARTGLIQPDRAQMTQSQFHSAETEYKGLYISLQELHIPFDVLSQEYLELMAESGGLKRYQAIILADAGELLADTAKVLDEWVRAGGFLVATASSGVTEDGTVQLASLPATKQMSMEAKREALWSSYYAEPQENINPNDYTGPMVPLYGVAYTFQWRSQSKGGYNLLEHAPFSPPEKAYGNVQVEQRGYGSWQYGEGKGIVIPFTVGRGYYDLGLGAYRDFLAKVLREETEVKEKLTVNISEQVEVTLNQNGAKMVIHLINMSGARKQNFGEHLPVPGGTISVEGEGVTAHALKSDQRLEIQDGKIFLPTLDLFEVVVVEGL